MKLALLPIEEARTVLHEALGGDPSEVSGVADLVRGEVSARRACQRSSTIRRVRRLAAPVASLDETLVAEVCDLLEREGDIVVGTGGVMFATPLRAVDLGGGEIRIASSLPTKRLAARLVGTWRVDGTSRTCRVEDADRARSAIVAAGGVVLTPAAWACLDRVPCADQAWLDGLDRRLRSESEGAGSLERDESLAWRGCVATEAGFRWAPAESAKAARLWRARNRWGHWLFAWTDEGTPKTSPFVSLRPNDGTRSAFAVVRALGSPVRASLEKRDEVAILSVPHWLPIAEYRFLAISSSSSVAEGSSRRWTLALDQLAYVLGVLRKRLGLVFHEEASR
ncbi:MAG: hypothetical protein ABIK85_08325 [Candidatus Eisenbacteria bacterium]